jgi:heme exporter protein C
LWGRLSWGKYWVWDARLTSSLMLFLIFVAYLLLRQFGGPGSEKLSAGLALFGMANVPFIYVSVNYWRTLHPKTSVVPTLPVEMGRPLWFCVTAFLLLFLALLKMRSTLERQRARVDALYLSHDEA